MADEAKQLAAQSLDEQALATARSSRSVPEEKADVSFLEVKAVRICIQVPLQLLAEVRQYDWCCLL